MQRCQVSQDYPDIWSFHNKTIAIHNNNLQICQWEVTFTTVIKC